MRYRLQLDYDGEEYARFLDDIRESSLRVTDRTTQDRGFTY